MPDKPSLPVSLDAEARDKATAKKQILIVDDDKGVRDGLRRHLQHTGYSVFTAEDGVEALTQLDRHEIDLIILDVKMPGVDGFEVCDTIKRTQDVPIVFLTGAQDQIIQHYMPQMVQAVQGDCFFT